VFVLGSGFAMADPPLQAKSSVTRTIELWVRIPIKALMSACVNSVFVLGSGFAMANLPLQAIFSLKRTIELWVRNPIKFWTSAWVHSVFVLGSGFAMADPQSKKYFRSLEQWHCLFESHSSYGCLRAFILFVLGSGFAAG
jgi:hypothetical protein